MEQGRSTSLRLGSGSNKYIPRDLSDSLGKLPPQARDLEEAVLGGLMLEKGALNVTKFLKPVHFYADAHREIYQAILDLHLASEPVDMRTVVNQLRKTAKLELVGGAYMIAEITSKVSSAANIEYHSRVIIEMSMKREMIALASQVHHDAYEDTVDVFELFDRIKNSFAYLEERETRDSGPDRIAKLWEATLIEVKPEDDPPLIYIGDMAVCTSNNHSLVVGKKKSRKSLLVTHLLHSFLRKRENLAHDIAVFDSEQGKVHVWKSRDRLYRMTNQLVPTFYLRGQSPRERREFVSMTVHHWTTKFTRKLRIIVLDGIRDFMSNINDPDESTEVIVWLEKLTLDYNLHIINVLHLNKTDKNPRGHIGTELQNKAEVTIEVEYDERTTHSIVKCESSREKPFDTFAFTHGPTGLPELVGVPIGEEQVSDKDQIEKLIMVFDDQLLKHKDLVESMRAHFGVGQSKAKQLIAKFVKKGYILKSGKDRDPNCTYKLNVTPSTAPPPTNYNVKPDPQQALPLADTPPPIKSTDELPF